MKLNLKKGLLDPIVYKASPHLDERPAGTVINTVVVHGISLPKGEFGTCAIEDFFCGQLDINAHPSYADIAALRVSAHLLIKREGEMIQFVPFHKRAWHAGVSQFRGEARCNDFSIGIELEGTDDQPYEAVQYQHLSQIIRLLMQAYPAITKERIVGHADIAPSRKTDPGPYFDWAYLKGIL